MSSDPFAALRVSDTGVSEYSYSPLHKHEKHQTPGIVFAGNPQKTADKHVIHQKHPQSAMSAKDVEIAALIGATGMPAEWAAGIVQLQRMPRPRFANVDRWQQVVTDAERMATTCHEHAVDLGWSLNDLFAFDLDADREWEALITRIRGGQVLIANESMAVVKRKDGSTSWHERRGFFGVPAGASLIWQVDRWARR